MSVSYGGDSITFADGSTVSSGWQGFKNRIINGGMVVDQRNAGGTSSSQDYLVDRWRTWFGTGTYTFQQVSDAPTGFSNSLKVTKTNTTQSNYAILLQHIEGYNVADLVGATLVQLQYRIIWVKSSVTGTFSAALNNSDASRSYMFSYTINAQNTWEYKTVTIPGDTTGTWYKNNNSGIQIRFNFGNATGNGSTGSWLSGDYLVASSATTNLGTTNGATWQITGVQIEKGSTASSFEWRPFTTELQLCQRYFCSSWSTGVAAGSGTERKYFGLYAGAPATSPLLTYVNWPVEMRTSPTVTLYDTANPPVANKTYRGGDGKSAYVSQSGTRQAYCGSTDTTSSSECVFLFKAEAEL